MEEEKYKKIVNFFFELLHLKRVPRSGLTTIGIKDIDSVAEHICVAAQIAFILGKIEKVNAERAALMTLFHDNGEARTFDICLLQKIYLNNHNDAESEAFLDQINDLPAKEDIEELFQEFVDKKTPEAQIAREADKLELALQAKLYINQGHKDAQLWIDNLRPVIKSDSGKKLLEIIEKCNSNDWWRTIPEIEERINKLEK